jgi:Disulphide bond corrector protein DsbC
MKGHIFTKNIFANGISQISNRFNITTPNSSKMKKQLFALLTALSTFFAANAQLAEPVQWSFEAQKVGANAYQVKIIANIQEGWYVYPQQLDKPGPIPTQIKFDNNPNVILNGTPIEVGDRKEDYDQNFEMKVTKLVHNVQFIQNVVTMGNPDAIKGRLTFMTCNGEMCMPPKNVEFKVKLN